MTLGTANIATFRGVKFFVDTSSRQFGRRTVVNEYPDRDTPYTEDLGRGARGFDVTGYVVGADHELQADAVIDACEQFGPALLTHPKLGSLMVNCQSLEVRDERTETRITYFSIKFVEAGQPLYPAPTTSASNDVRVKADAAWDAQLASFNAGFDVSGMPDFGIDSAVELVNDFVDHIRAVFKPGFLDAAESFVASLQSLETNINSLIYDPEALGLRLQAIIQDVGALATGAPGYEALKRIYDFTADDLADGTPTRLQQIQNQNQLLSLLNLGALFEAGRTLNDIDFDSADDAEIALDWLTGAIDDQMLIARNDEFYSSLSALYAAVTASVPDITHTLPRTRTLVLSQTQAALLTAQSLYGDASRGEEIALRNAVRHPGFLPGGVELRVLTDV